MLRVLHVISSLDPRTGGPAHALLGLAKAQKNAGLDVSMLATFAAGTDMSFAPTVREQGIGLELIGPTSTPLVWHYDLRGKMKEAVGKADVVHIHALWEEAQHRAARTALEFGKPYLIRPCGMLDPWSLAQSPLKKKMYLAWRLRANLNQARALHFTSAAEHQLTGPLHLKAPAIVEPNGVDLAEFETLPQPGAFRSLYRGLDGRRIVLFLSRVHHKKGIDLLINAFHKLGRADATLVIVGPDYEGYTAKMQGLAEQLGLRDRVLFTGMLKGKERIAALADADVFALPSHQENFGIAVVEALAARTPVIVSDKVNIQDEIAAAGVGKVVPLDVDALARALGEYLSNPEELEAARGKTQAFVRERYDWARIGRDWVGHYGRICGK